MIAKEIGNDQLAYDISYWIVFASTLFLFIFQHLNNLKTHIQKILAWCQFCLFTNITLWLSEEFK